MNIRGEECLAWGITKTARSSSTHLSSELGSLGPARLQLFLVALLQIH
jgi:hypothetical protein